MYVCVCVCLCCQVTRRYAEFSGAIVSINQSHPNEKVTKCLSSLQQEVENFILRMAAEFPDRKEQLIFLINNYDMLLAVLSVSRQQVGWECHTSHWCVANQNQTDQILFGKRT